MKKAIKSLATQSRWLCAAALFAVIVTAPLAAQAAPNPAYAAARPVRAAVASAPLAPVANQGNAPAAWKAVDGVTRTHSSGEYKYIDRNAVDKYALLCFGGGTFLLPGPVAVRSTNGNQFEEFPGYKGGYNTCYGNGRFISVRGLNPITLSYSTDLGVNWRDSGQIAVEGTGSGNPVDKITYGDGRFLVLLREFYTGRTFRNRIFTSADGIQWNEAAAPANISPKIGAGTTYGMQTIAYGGGKWVFSRKVDDGVTSGNFMGYLELPASSGPNARWTETITTNLGDNYIRDIVWGNGRFVAIPRSVFPHGKILYSNDGITWTYATDNPFGTAEITSLAYGAGWFVAGAGNGRIAYSSDGNKWTLVANSPLNEVSVIAFGEFEQSAYRDEAGGKWAYFVAIGGGKIANVQAYSIRDTPATAPASGGKSTTPNPKTTPAPAPKR